MQDKLFYQLIENQIDKPSNVQYFSDLRELISVNSPIKTIKQIDQHQIVELVNGLEIPLQNIISLNNQFATQYQDYQAIIACRC